MTFRRAAAILFVDAPFLTLLGAVLVLIILNQLDLELGLFYVMWAPGPSPLGVFLNGLGAGLFFCTLAYLGYLIRAKSDPTTVRERRPLLIWLVAPYLVLSALPIVFPDWFPTTTNKLWFGVGLAGAVGVFWGLVILVTVNSPSQQFDQFLAAGNMTHVVTFVEPPAALAPADVVGISGPVGKPVAGPVAGPVGVTMISPTQYQITFPPLAAAGMYRFTIAAQLPPVALPASVSPTLTVDQSSHMVTFAAPPAAFTAANIAGVIDPAGVSITGPFAVTKLSPTQYRISFPAPPAAAGQYHILFASNLPGVVGAASVSPTLAAGDTDYVVTFAVPPAAFAAAGLAGVTDPAGNPVPGPFTVTMISPVKYRIAFPAPLAVAGRYHILFAGPLPGVVGAASVPLTLPAGTVPAPLTLPAGTVSHVVTFAAPPAAFTAANIAGVIDPAGNPVAGPVAVTKLSPTQYRITFPAPPAAAGQYHILFASNLPGVVGTAAVSPVLAAGTAAYVVTFAVPPAAFAAADLAGVTDPAGNPVPGPFGVAPLAPHSPTQYRITFPAPLAAAGEYAFAFNPAATVAPTTHQPGFPDDGEADPPVWLQANGLFAAAVFFYCVPVGYSLGVDSTAGMFWVTGLATLFALLTLFVTTPRRVWSTVLFGYLESRNPLLSPLVPAARWAGAVGLLVLGAVLGGFAIDNLGASLWRTTASVPFLSVPAFTVMAFAAAVLGAVYWVCRNPDPTKVVRHVGMAALVIMFGVYIGLALARAPGIGWAAVALVALVFIRATFRAKYRYTQLPNQSPTTARVVVGLSGLVLALLTGYLTVEGRDGKLPAAMSVSLLLGVFGVAYGALHFYAGRWFYPAIAAAGLLVAFLASARPFPHRLDALADYYRWKDVPDQSPAADRFKDEPEPPLGRWGDRAGKPDLDQYSYYDKAHADALKARIAAVEPKRDRLQLDDGAVLAGWKCEARKSAPPGKPDRGLPPLVIVTTAGGASTSAVYTFAVLTNLEKWFPGFHRHVRLITGASGGMVGAAYYRALLHKWDTDPDARAEVTDLGAYLEKQRKNLEKDFLGPIVQGMAFKDVPKFLGCPLGYADDRGRRLETAWHQGLDGALGVNFRDLREQEREGKYPSLVFSPMMVEDGRPLLISTLDLSDLVRTPGDVDYKKPYRAIEFFKLFPEYGWRLQLGTAARLSATFPYLSPAVTIPTLPPRRLVDAGYYDNYGQDIALGWLERGAYPKHPDRCLLSYTGQVVIINIRPYLRVDSAGSALTQAEWDARFPNGKPPDRSKLTQAQWDARFPDQKPVRYLPDLTDPLQPFTTPIDGGDAARKMGMVARNNNLTGQLLHVFQPDAKWLFVGQKPLADALLLPPIRVVTFRGDSTASLNWTLPQGQIDGILEAAKKPFRCPEPGEPEDPDLRRLTDALKEYFPPPPRP